MPRVMPTSSTVWCASMCRSPSALMSRSMSPCLAIWSSMWSRNGTPVSSDCLPVPSRLTATRMRVSLVLRVISAVRIKGASLNEAEDILQGVEHCAVFVRGADRDAQAVGQQRVGVRKVLYQYFARFQGKMHGVAARLAGKARKYEIAGAGVGGDARQRGQACRQGGAAGPQVRCLLVQDRLVAQHGAQRRLGQHIDVVGRPDLVELTDPGRVAGQVAEPQPGQPDLGNGAQHHDLEIGRAHV